MRSPTSEHALSLPLISFCTSCFNRAYQLKQTFAANASTISDDPRVEWIILNYSSQDDLHEYMINNLPAISRRIIYAVDSSRRPWHLSVAKNIAHRIASGLILMNLDCDNYIGPSIPIIKDHFARGTKMLHLWSGIFRDGTCGRIATTKDTFYALGGYDEALHPMGYQDRDFLRRALKSGLGSPCAHIKCPIGSSIINSKLESIRYCATKGLTWEDYERANRVQSDSNIASGRFIANVDTARFKGVLDIYRGKLTQ